ncbi:MAG: hypothetical protein ACM3X4_12985 [Ignavibacteriales bacterium]
MAGSRDIRGDGDRRSDDGDAQDQRDGDRVQAARRLLENAREKRENPYKTPPNLLTTKDHQQK